MLKAERVALRYYGREFQSLGRKLEEQGDANAPELNVQPVIARLEFLQNEMKSLQMGANLLRQLREDAEANPEEPSDDR